MADMMCIRGYGVKLYRIATYFDVCKLCAFVQSTYDLNLQTSVPAEGDLYFVLNEIEIELCKKTNAYDLPELFELVDTSRLVEYVSNAQAEWFLYLPACMSWEVAHHAPKSKEEADALLLKTLRPFLKDGASGKAVAACFDYINDIS